MSIITIGIDLAKNIFAVHGALLHKSGMKPALASILNPHRLF